MVVKKQILLFSFFLIASLQLTGQNISEKDIDNYFSKLGLAINWPTELKPEIKSLKKKAFTPKAFSLYYPSEKIQILLERISPRKSYFPNLANGSRLAHYAGNDEDSIISLHSLGDEELKQLNAEWGTQAFFKPKKEFSNYGYCMLISMYDEEKGQVFAYFMFDDPENHMLDHSYRFVQFID